MRVSRRQFLFIGGAAALGLALRGLEPIEPGEAEAAAGAAAPVSYGDWRDVYREKWSWDRVVRSTHFTNCWYQSHCCWNVYVKDGVVWREEQAAVYPQTNTEVPDFNPRGCQKGACFSERMYDPTRVKYPLARVGERGSGKWKRVTWEEALDDLAGEFVRVVSEEGPDRVVWDVGPLFTFGAMAMAQARFAQTAGNVSLDMNSEIGDSRRGTAETFGKIVFGRSADDYFNSDLILIWGCNPVATQIPNAHFLTESRYNGATLVTIAPDYSPSSIHSDLFVPVKPGSDAALALALCKVIVDEQLYDREFIKEQTDLPMLVRDDNGLLLRQSDLESGGDDELFYRLDAGSGRVVEASRKTLRLEGEDPALEGAAEVTIGGDRVGVRTVFEHLKRRLEAYDPESASRMCGTAPALIVDLARKVAAAKAATNVAGSNFSKYYHGNLIERAQALLFSLCGHIGKKGGGFEGFPYITNDGFDMMAMTPAGLWDKMGLYAQMLPKAAMLRLRGYSEEMVAYEMARQSHREGRMFTCGVLFWALHGGLIERSGLSAQWDPYMKRTLADYLDESLERQWQTMWPRRGDDPRMLFGFGSNILRRIRSYPLLLEHLWPKLSRIAMLDWRMTSTAMFSDYLLPVSVWYERDEHKWGTPLMPFLHASEKAANSGEAWHEWRILVNLAERIRSTAEERKLDRYDGRAGRTHSLLSLYDELTWGGKFDEHAESEVAGEIVRRSTNLADDDWDRIRKHGFTRFTSPGASSVSIGTAAEFVPGETITPLTDHVHGKQPYPTLTRRIQFYIDHPFYLELDEALPRHKESPAVGGNYPLMLTGGHTRWSIHGQWRDDALLLRQQRGAPVMYMSVQDAVARGIEDGGQVRVYNDFDSFLVQAKIAAAVRPGQLILYHAWENHQFLDGKGFQNLMPTPINPVELAGGQYHLRPMTICMQPGQFDRDTRVEVRPV